jgi:type IV pilus assembly protein PilV
MTMTANRSSHPARAPRRQGGMSLIEVLVAVVLLAVGLLGMLGLLAISSKNSSDAQDRNRAALLANELVSAMWLNNSVDITTDPLKTAYNNWLKTACTPGNSYCTTGSSSKGLNLTAAPTVATITPSEGKGALITITWKAPYKTVSSGAANVTQEVTNTYTTEVVLP